MTKRGKDSETETPETKVSPGGQGTGEATGTGLVPTESHALAKPIATSRGGEEIRSEDIRLPVYRILQPTSTEVQTNQLKAGLFKHTISGETRETIEFVPFYMKLSRVMFDPGSPKGAPVCASNDMLHGTSCDCGCGNVCANCRHKDWQQDAKTNRREPPACSVTYNFVSLDAASLSDSGEISPFVLRFAKSSAQAGQKIASAIKQTLRRDPSTKLIHPVDLWAFVWRISLVAKTFPQGLAYVAEVERLRKTTEDEAQWAEALYGEFRTARKIEIEEVEE